MVEKIKEKIEVSKDEKGMRNLKKSPLKSGEYIAYVFEPWGASKALRRKIIVSRFEYEDGVVVLKNEKENFEEIYPALENNLDYIEDLKEVTAKIKVSKLKLKNILNGTDKKTNIWNVKYELFKLEANLHKLKYGNTPAFMSLDGDNNPTFEFLRKGSTLHPLSTDIDTSKIYVPSDYKKKKSAMTVRNKKEKYGKFAQGLITTATLIILIVGVILNVVGGIFIYKAYTYIDSESATAQMILKFDGAANQCLQTMVVQNVELRKTSNEVSGIVEQLKDSINPKTTIQGTEPVDFK